MRVSIIQVNPVAADADGICASQTPGAAGNLTINGALASAGVVTLSQAARVSITAVGNDSARVFTVYGKNRQNLTISEAIAGPNAGTSVGKLNFKEINRVAVDAATADAITVGNANALESEWLPWGKGDSKKNIQVALSSNANFTYELQHTNSDVFATGFLESSADAIADETFKALTANKMCPITNIYMATRLAITSFVAGSAKLNVLED